MAEANTFYKGIRFRIYPTKTQRNLLARTFGCCRLVYNWGLDKRKELYKAGEKSNNNAVSNAMTLLKKDKDHLFLNEVDSIALQQSLKDLDTAFTNFFDKRAGYPKYKRRRDSHKSYRTINQDNSIRIEGKRIKLPKLGWMKVKQSMPVGRIKSVTVEQVPSGKYYAVLLTEHTPELKYNNGRAVGIDVGIKEFYTDSNGNTVANPRYLARASRKLRREQRKLSRKVGARKGETPSKNFLKQKHKVALAHEKVVFQREDFLHKQSTKLVNENQVICIEDLDVKGMLRDNRLSKEISDVSWSSFFRMLEYKAAWHGCEVIRVPRFFASSQTCSHCGYENPDVKDLKVREWDCPVCGTHHDRDGNAAINILAKGLEMRETAQT